MDDSLYGKRNKKGDWAPGAALEPSALWQWPPQAAKWLGWVVGFVWPWHALFLLITGLTWWLVIPEPAVMATLEWSWALKLFAWNWLGLLAYYGLFEGLLYVRKTQGRRFKYNGKFPAEQPSDVFWFKSQNIDNFIRSFFISIPIGSAIEVLLLWQYANGGIAALSWETQAAMICAWIPLAMFVQELHFFAIHRLSHTPFLYKWVHSVHHNSVNPSPWSSMSMHPVEGLMYFAVALWVLVLPAHPLIAIHLFTIPAFGAIVGHIGFDRIELPASASTQPHSYAHYLHHKHFEVNYCDNGSVPLDTWFGSWHDGSAEGERRMQERYAAKVARLNTPQA